MSVFKRWHRLQFNNNRIVNKQIYSKSIFNCFSVILDMNPFFGFYLVTPFL